MGGIRSIEFSFISPGPSPGENAGEPIRHQRGVRIKRTLKKRFERAGRDKIGFSPRNSSGRRQNWPPVIWTRSRHVGHMNGFGQLAISGRVTR